MVSGVDTPGSAHGVAVTDTYVYIADSDSGLAILHPPCPLSSRVGEGVDVVPAETFLTIHPNPGYREASIELATPAAGPVRVDVYDIAGRRVRSLQTGVLAMGEHHLRWDGLDEGGRSVAGGVYFIRASAPGGVAAARFVLRR